VRVGASWNAICNAFLCAARPDAVVELLRHDPDRPLDGQLPLEVRNAWFGARRAVASAGPRRRCSDGRFADLLWTLLERDVTSGCDDICGRTCDRGG